MKSLAFVLLVACGGSKPAPTTGSGSAEPPGPVTDTRSELEKRRDVGCNKLKPRLVACAVEDAKASLESGKITKKQFDLDTAPEVRAKLGDKWMESCRVEMSSRQVRVLEVCDREEQQCGPLVSCLGHLNETVK
ncbi:MAG: hypothetical protein M4D80_04735 [Myxococcota bacterium]|nr:hypothetical protein [Deltaproteobacteria bacterium]MDQ3334444.1 hypothetical protein [Myxococcota bacterium]